MDGTGANVMHKSRRTRKGGLFGIGMFKTDRENLNNCKKKYKTSRKIRKFCGKRSLAKYDFTNTGCRVKKSRRKKSSSWW